MIMKVKSVSGRVPEYKTEGASGMDLEAFIDEDIVIMPGKRALVHTGLFFEVPEGCECQIRARSGLAVKHGIGLVNGIGTIDSDYRGEIMIPLINWGEEPFTVHDGDRIAQAVIMSYNRVDVELADELSDTERGKGGFGHTGV
jgi:dUTP pyrophosphatase